MKAVSNLNPILAALAMAGALLASQPAQAGRGCESRPVSTETLVRTIEHAGYTTGVNIDRMAEAADYARQIVARARAQTDAGGAAGSNA
jgi:pyruvate/oxaloacetate carboxyltransferase